MNKKLILASGSPRRKELLDQYGVEHTVVLPKTNEIWNESLPIEKAIEQIAKDKAWYVVKQHPECLVLAADTVVVCEGKILGKPKDEEDALAMLALLSSNTHYVITGVCILDDQHCITFHEKTTITFRELSQQEIQDYVASLEPFDKAGAYAIQGGANVFVESIKGDYDNVVGLPVTKVLEELKKLW